MTSGIIKRSECMFYLGKLIHADKLPDIDLRYARAMQSRFYKDKDLRAKDWKEVRALLSKHGGDS